MCGSWGGAWGRPPLDPWPQNPASLYLGHFGSIFSPLRLSLLICTLGINEAATEGSYQGWGGVVWNTLGSCKFRFVPNPGSWRGGGAVCVHLGRSCAHLCILALKGFTELWPLPGFQSGSLMSCVVGDSFPSTPVLSFLICRTQIRTVPTSYVIVKILVLIDYFNGAWLREALT